MGVAARFFTGIFDSIFGVADECNFAAGPGGVSVGPVSISTGNRNDPFEGSISTTQSERRSYPNYVEIQAQGGGLDKRAVLGSDEPITKAEGQALVG